MSESKEVVVLAVNDSQSSHNAVNWAIKHILNPTKHHVHILYIVPPPVEPAYYFTASAAALYTTGYVEEINKQRLQQGAELVQKYRSNIERAFNNQMEVEMVIGKGEARDEIIDYVEKVKADLLILGSRGLGALKRAFLGSTSDYCIHHCVCPVVVVKPPRDHKPSSSTPTTPTTTTP